MNMLWTSRKIYVHPSTARSDTVGRVTLLSSGSYVLKVGSKVVNIPQDWGSMIHEQEESEGVKP